MTQAKIVAKIRKLGYKVTVLNASARNRAGIPDILISHNGKAVFVEIKIDKDKLSKLQKEFQNEFWMSWMMLRYDSKLKEYSLELAWVNNHEFALELEQKLNAL